ncbi:hypothetical protein EJ05DRAFT_440706, partial [Pseudovirgaria hyperparasitica]
KRQVPSNVTRIGHAVLAEDSKGHPQIVYYQAGVGTGMALSEQVLGGSTGAGLSENVREAYSFLAHNYTDGDEIFLVGFSRGAFTARSIAGLIGGFGLLEKEALPYFYDIFLDWEHAGVKGYKPSAMKFITGFELKAVADQGAEYIDAYRTALLERKLTQEVDITAIGVWDTVGALGIPTTPLLQKVGFPDFVKEYKFTDTSIDSYIHNAFHALALDEQRAAYAPTMWSNPPGNNTNLKQVWFPGVHSNVGGSYDDTAMADITLAWMMDQLSPWIDFKPGYISTQVRANDQFDALVQSQGLKEKRGWALGKIYQSCKFPTSLGGKKNRTPHIFHGEDPFKGTKYKEPLENTNEYVHASVRVRIDLGGKGWEDKGRYAPAGLSEWVLRNENRDHGEVKTEPAIDPNVNGTNGASNGTSNGSSHTNGHTDGATDGRTNGLAPASGHIRWVYQGKDTAAQGKVMYEDKMGPIELELLGHDPVAYKAVFEN